MKGGVNVSDSIGTNRAVDWIESAGGALFTAFEGAVRRGELETASKWLDMLERLGVI